jgi:hypothetical protein
MMGSYIIFKLWINVPPPPITPLIAWCATSEPAPKAMPETMVEPKPENIPPDFYGTYIIVIYLNFTVYTGVGACFGAYIGGY